MPFLARQSRLGSLWSRGLLGWLTLSLCLFLYKMGVSQVVLVVKNLPANAGDVETRVQSLGQEDPLEEGMATYSSILAWRIPWTEEPGGLQSIKSQKVGQD